jgi:hypothetical protein
MAKVQHKAIPALIAVAIAVVMLTQVTRRFEIQPHTVPAHIAPASAAPNPLFNMLKARPDIQRSGGVAIAVLIDASGSMRDTVAGPSGQARKIDVARENVLELIRKAQVYAQEHPDQKLLLGVYAFSSINQQQNCRTVIAPGQPDLAAAQNALERLQPDGGTPIGNALIFAKQHLDATRLSRSHLLVVTDGQNTQGYEPAAVVEAINRLDAEERPAVYFVAFDIGADVFTPVRDAGGLVLAAADALELQQTLDYILSGKILAEQPLSP